jgi:hypothetical protein
MLPPKTIFIDTEIFDHYQYNFGSQHLQALVKKFPRGVITLLMPDVTLKEVKRHIVEEAEKIRTGLTKAQEAAFLVTHLPNWPNRKERKELIDKIAINLGVSLDMFMYQLCAVHLGYDGISLEEIVGWYDEKKPPFSIGKPKEFPDAIALAMIVKYAREKDISIAVISNDKDFKHCCEGRSNLSHFSTVDEYIQALDSDDPRIMQLNRCLGSYDFSNFNQAIAKDFEELQFIHSEDDDAEIRDIKVTSTALDALVPLHIGDNQCEITVFVNIAYSAHVRMVDPDSWTSDSETGRVFYHHHLSGMVEDTAHVEGIITCKLKPNTGEIIEVLGFSFNDDLISIDERPWGDDEPLDDNEYQ